MATSRLTPFQDAPALLTVGGGVELLDFGDHAGLFHEGRQELAALNETALHIWRALAGGQDTAQAAASLAALGAGDDAAGYVADAVELWLAGGWMLPPEAAFEGEPAVSYDLSVLGVGFAVELFGAPSAGVLDVLETLRGEAPRRHRLQVAEWRDRYILRVDRVGRGLHAAEAIAPAIKAALTERLTASVSDGFLAHGGLVAVRGQRIFLSGAPGAGKSTLTMALAHAGFACLSDDIVHVDARGWMKGAPFAPALKPGSWPLLAGRIEGLDALPTHRRSDGQLVRYLPAAVSHGEARPLDHLIVLDRQPDGPAELLPLTRLEAVRVLLNGAFASAGRLSAEEAKGLAEGFGAAGCHVLRYADLDGAVGVLGRLADG